MLDSLTLLENEEILFETKTINRECTIIKEILVILIFLILINPFYLYYRPPLIFMFLNIIINIIFSGILFLYLELVLLREINSIYIITNKRILKIIENRLIHKNRDPKKIEIYLEDIAFIQINTFIHVVQKGPGGEIHYNENDTKSFYLSEKLDRIILQGMHVYTNLKYKKGRRTSQIEQKPKVKTILFNIKGKNTLQIRQNIIDILVDLIPLRKHPNLDNVYLNAS